MQAGAAAAVLFVEGPSIIAFSDYRHSSILHAMIHAAMEKGFASRGFLLRAANMGAHEENLHIWQVLFL
jgi:homoserine kinase